MQSTSPPVVRLREDAFARWTESLALRSETEAAEYIGVSQATLNRIRRGEITPGEKFIAALLAASRLQFEELFEVAS